MQIIFQKNNCNGRLESKFKIEFFPDLRLSELKQSHVTLIVIPEISLKKPIPIAFNYFYLQNLQNLASNLFSNKNINPANFWKPVYFSILQTDRFLEPQIQVNFMIKDVEIVFETDPSAIFKDINFFPPWNHLEFGFEFVLIYSPR